MKPVRSVSEKLFMKIEQTLYQSLFQTRSGAFLIGSKARDMYAELVRMLLQFFFKVVNPHFQVGNLFRVFQRFPDGDVFHQRGNRRGR